MSDETRPNPGTETDQDVSVEELDDVSGGVHTYPVPELSSTPAPSPTDPPAPGPSPTDPLTPGTKPKPPIEPITP